MKQLIACLLVMVLFCIVPLPAPSQRNESPEQLGQEIETLKQRVSELEKQLQTVENVEKMELVKNYADVKAKLADANARSAIVDIDKLRRELKDHNDEWLGKWSERFLGLIAVFVTILLGVGAVFWFWLRHRTDRLIADEVGKNIDGYKGTVDQVETMKNELRELKKEHAASMLKPITYFYFKDENSHPEYIKALSEEILLQVFDEKRYDMQVRSNAAKVLAHRKSTRLVPPLLEFLNSAIHSDRDWTDDELGRRAFNPCIFVGFLEKIRTLEAYQGLSKFLNRLLTENPRHKSLFLEETVYSLMWISFNLNMGDSARIMAKAVSHLEDLEEKHGLLDLDMLITYFDRFNEPAGIKEILFWHVKNGASDAADLKDKCVEALEGLDPGFVEEWRAENTNDDAESS